MAASTSSSTNNLAVSMTQVKLNDGNLQPVLGFGTYKVGYIPALSSSTLAGNTVVGKIEGVADRCIKDALDVGYRFFDCAEFYGNEVEIGNALKSSGIDRSEIYLESKVWTTTIFNGPSAVRAQVLKSIKDLQCNYLDICCIHWPVPGKHVDAYIALQALQAEGLIKSLAISNYVIEDYVELMSDDRVLVKPAVNQIEVNPFLFRKQTIDYFKEQDIVIQSYRALRNGEGVGDDIIAKIAAKNNRSPAQILLKWCLQHDCVVIAKTLNKNRMEENANIFDFTLNDDDMSLLDNLTTEENISAYVKTYQKCVNKGTPLDGCLDNLRTNFTAH